LCKSGINQIEILKKNTSILWLSILLSIATYSISHAQIIVNGNVGNMLGRNILVSIYSEGTHQLIEVEGDGKFVAELPRFEECLIVVYGAKTQPITYSFDTQQGATEPIKLSINLNSEQPKEESVRIDGPQKRYTTDGYAYTTAKFNLDNVKDKPKFALLMSKMSVDLKTFYKDRVLPKERLGLNTTSNDAVARKSEHRIGQEIYETLNRKRMQEKNLAKIKAQYTADHSAGMERCQVEYTYLKAEATYIKTSYELAKLEYEKEKLIVRRNENNGRSASTRKLIEAEKKRDRLEKEKEIAGITLINKQADCWELDAQAKLDLEMQKGDAADQTMVSVRRLDINNIRMTSRLQNAKKLYKEYNLLANDLTGRDRVVELANAQKYIAEQEEIKLYQAENTLEKWKIKHQAENIYGRQVEAANNAFLKQREDAFQAEMAYLEHIWHLLEKPGLEPIVEDIFARQNDLLAIVQPNRPILEQPVAVAETETDAELLAQIRIESNTREDSRTKKLTFDQDYYEIIDDGTSRQYFKNGKPITRITYEFETKRQFGEILENVKDVERRSRLFDLFKKRIQ
jgi:hypothetical protein